MTWTPPTSPTPTAAPSTSAPIASWIRRYRVVSGIVGAFVGLMILGGISKAVSSHQSNTQYVPVPAAIAQQASDLQQQIQQSQAQTQWMKQATQRQANDNQFEQGLGYAGSQ